MSEGARWVESCKSIFRTIVVFMICLWKYIKVSKKVFWKQHIKTMPFNCKTNVFFFFSYQHGRGAKKIFFPLWWYWQQKRQHFKIWWKHFSLFSHENGVTKKPSLKGQGSQGIQDDLRTVKKDESYDLPNNWVKAQITFKEKSLNGILRDNSIAYHLYFFV